MCGRERPPECIGADHCAEWSASLNYVMPGMYIEIDNPYCYNAEKLTVYSAGSQYQFWVCTLSGGPRRILAPRHAVEVSQQPPEPIKYEEAKPPCPQAKLKL